MIWNFMSKKPTAQFAQELGVSMFCIQIISMKSLMKEMESPCSWNLQFKTLKGRKQNEV